MQEIAGKPETAIIRKTEDYSVNGMYNEALKELQSGRVREAKNYLQTNPGEETESYRSAE